LFLKSTMNDFFSQLLKRFKKAKKIAFMGIGEEKLRDDAVGLYIIAELLEESNDTFLFINAGVDPLSRINDIINFKPSHLVILDICTLNKEPGTVAIIERESMESLIPISTHTLPIHIIIDYLLEKLPDLDVFLLGFVPESIEGFNHLSLYKDGELTFEELNESEDLPFFQFQLTNTLKKVADEIIFFIRRLIKKM